MAIEDLLACHTCGAANSIDNSYCAHCGAKLEHSSIDENTQIHETFEGNLFEKHQGLENIYTLERSFNRSASAFFLKKNEVLYKIFENGKNLAIQSGNNESIGTAIKTGGLLFPDWSIEDNNHGLKALIRIHPHFKGELTFKLASGDEVYTLAGIKGANNKGHFMKLTEFQAYNTENNKMIQICIPIGIKKGLLLHEPPNNLEIKADTGIDEFIIAGFTAIILKNFLTLPKKQSGFDAGFAAGLIT